MGAGWPTDLALCFAFLNCTGDAAAKARRTLFAFTIYLVSATVRYLLLRRRDVEIAKVGALYAVFSCVGTTALGVVGFGEKIGVRGWVGVALGIAAIALIAAEEYGSS